MAIGEKRVEPRIRCQMISIGLAEKGLTSTLTSLAHALAGSLIGDHVRFPEPSSWKSCPSPCVNCVISPSAESSTNAPVHRQRMGTITKMHCSGRPPRPCRIRERRLGRFGCDRSGACRSLYGEGGRKGARAGGLYRGPPSLCTHLTEINAFSSQIKF